MWCLLKSQINGKTFLVFYVSDSRDLERIKYYVEDMKLSAELFLEQPGLPNPMEWSSDDIKVHTR